MPYLSPALNVMVVRRAQSGPRLDPRFRRIGKFAGLAEGPGGFRLDRRRAHRTILIEELSRARPGYAILGEESGSGSTGRTNPIASSSIRSTARPISCTASRSSPSPSRWSAKASWCPRSCYNPVTDEMYVAEKGHGAYLNNKRLRVAARKSPKEALFATGIPFLGRARPRTFLG